MTDELRTETGLFELFDREKRNTSFVFLFGAPMSGKSVVTSSIIKFLSSTSSCGHVTPFTLSRGSAFDNGSKEFRRRLRANAERQLPSRTTLTPEGEPLYISYRFSPEKALAAPELQVTFLDVPGDILDAGRQSTEYGALTVTINALLKVDGLKLAFILASTPSTAREDDEFVSSFIGYVSGINQGFERSKFLLLVTKWDTYSGGLEPTEFVAETMPLTSARLRAARSTIAAFSVGDVVTLDGRPAIARFEPMYAKAVVDWLYVTFTGDSLYNRSWWRKLLARIV